MNKRCSCGEEIPRNVDKCIILCDEAANAHTLDSLVRLPTYDESLVAIRCGEANPLHWFIHENEPAGDDFANIFREQLTEVLQWAQSNVPRQFRRGSDVN